jgi:transposase
VFDLPDVVSMHCIGISLSTITKSGHESHSTGIRNYYDELLRDLEWAIVQTAKQHDATTLDLLQTVPGIGQILSLVLVYEMHDIARFPRVQDFVSSCR